MKCYDLNRKNRVDIEQDLAQLEGTGLAEGVPLCRTCNQPLTEGQHLTVYARRAADTATFELGAMTCAKHRHNQRTQVHTEARELSVEGCIGRCSDHSSQSSWPILLHPQARVISPIGSTDGYTLSATPWFRSKIATSQPKDLYREMCWSVSPTTKIEAIDTNTSTVDRGGSL